jgi:hypothetical protein
MRMDIAANFRNALRQIGNKIIRIHVK